ncbi:hypothetical protein DY000_02008254 [Brassica cretica]|uniref:t-SNARE coiled-coil homology domain-containing protein n=1 Tax=Brassica cretica TaxID=69181 RepID=A0ABQ7CCW2_BRACR|nr:hypothetical protein DY000_02008254 [Brassica cretica]
MKLDGVYYPLNDSISWLTTCMEEMKQDIARIQNANDVARPPSIDSRKSPSIDRHHHASIDNRLAASIDTNPPRPHTMKSQSGFHTREEVDQLVKEIYRALKTTEERLDGRYDDIYFPMDLTNGALTSKVEAIQGELVEIQIYIARRPEASISINRRNNKSIDTNLSTSIDSDTNRGRLVPKTTSDMSNTPYHGKEISADTYAALTIHQFNLESLGDRLQRIENTTAAMKYRWRRGDEAMRHFTGTCALTSKVEAIQGELVEIQSYIARRPEASISIDIRKNKSIDTNHSTSIDSDTNRGRLVPNTTSDMSNTPYHGKEISADTYAALTRHQSNLESLGDRLQRIENTTAAMKDKWRRGDEAMRDFTDLLIADNTKDTKVDQDVNYPLLLRLF